MVGAGPSLSHATSRAIRNIMGYPGAIGADLLMQILGLGAIMMMLTVAVWGWRMLTRRHFDREALRLGCWILCTVFASGFASCWPHGGAWPLPTGLGGVVGDALVRAPALVLGPLGVFYRIIFGALFFAAMAATFLFASGMGAKERELPELDEDETAFDEDDDRGSVSLGWLVHAAMSAKARLGRLLTMAYRSLVASGAGAQTALRERREPSLNGRPTSLPIAPHDDADYEDEEIEEEEEIEDEEEEEEEEAPAARAPRKKAAPRASARKSTFELPPSTYWPHRRRRIASRSARPNWKPIRARWKACCRTSACAARS